MKGRDLVAELYRKYNLDSADIFKHQHFIIVTRSGIEKIQAMDDIRVTYQDKVLERDFAVIKALAAKGVDVEHADADTPTIETYGSALKGDFKNGNCNTWYVAEMAEKRALSRAVLKITGLYSYGVMGQDESDDFKDERKDITTQAISKAKDQILRGEKTAEEMIEVLEEHYIVGESIKYSMRQLKPQEKPTA